MRVLVASILLLTACKADPTKDFEALAERACACPEEDAACGTKVLADLVTFAGSHSSSDGDSERITAAGVRVNDCLSMTGVKPTEIIAALERFR
jgi:hypothetical protein